MISRANRYLLAIIAILAAVSALAVPVWAVSLQEEIEMGQKIDAEVLKQNPLSNSDAAQQEIEKTGQLIVSKAGLKRPELPYHFKVINSGKDYNAFSVPGGYIYFTEALWNMLNSEERAGVLAHEIVHSDRRHALDAMLKLQQRSTVLGILLILINANNDLQNIVDLAHSLYTLKYSRGDEKQADEIGTQYLYNSGLNPAGLLMAMRKLNRLEEAQGGRVPTILSNHPSTPERLKYLEALLAKMKVQFPQENVGSVSLPDKIGTVTNKSGSTISFTSTQTLKPGQILWVSGQGWDSNFEKKGSRPIARVIVTRVSGGNQGKVYPFSDKAAQQIVNGADVHALPVPAVNDSVGKITSDAFQRNAKIKIELTGNCRLEKMDRLMAVSPVWDNKSDNLAPGNIGYVVISDPSRPDGFAALSNPDYSYAPVEAGASLVKMNDPDAAKWIGPVISIGRSQAQVEVMASKALETGKDYDIAAPAWTRMLSVSRRAIARARFAPQGNKMVLNILEYTPGNNIDSIKNGLDIYER